MAGAVRIALVAGEASGDLLAAHLIAAQHGALLLRVHDVAATVDALKVWTAMAAIPVPRVSAPAAPTIRWPDED